MTYTPIKRNNNSNALKEWMSERTRHIRFCFKYYIGDFAHFIYELLKLVIVVCLAILIIRAPRVFIFALCPVIYFIVPFLFIKLASKLLSFVLRFFI